MSDFDPYHKWLGIPPKDQPPNHYRLLGVELFEPDPDVIDAAVEQKMLFVNQCAMGSHVEHSQRLLNELSLARVCLLNPTQKARYDAELSERLARPSTGRTRDRKTPERSQGFVERTPKATLLAPPKTHAWIIVSGVGFCLAVGIWCFWTPFKSEPVVEKVTINSNPLNRALALPGRDLASSTVDTSNEQSAPLNHHPSEGGERTDVAIVAPDSAGPKLTNESEIVVATDQQITEDAQTTQKIWARQLKTSVAITNGIGMELMLIPPGKFKMGSPAGEEGREQHEEQVIVTLTEPFYVGKTEVTQGQWFAVMKTEPWKDQDDVKEGANYPATFVSWDDTQVFCDKLSKIESATYRLLSEAEWEYSCRAKSNTRFGFGDDASQLIQHAWVGANAAEVNVNYAHGVAYKTPNAFGLHDMHGNVWEWCQDGYRQQLPGGDNPAVSAVDSNRLGRGGSWLDSADTCRSASRGVSESNSKNSALGFRVARVPTLKGAQAVNTRPVVGLPAPATPANLNQVPGEPLCDILWIKSVPGSRSRVATNLRQEEISNQDRQFAASGMNLLSLTPIGDRKLPPRFIGVWVDEIPPSSFQVHLTYPQTQAAYKALPTGVFPTWINVFHDGRQFHQSDIFQQNRRRLRWLARNASTAASFRAEYLKAIQSGMRPVMVCIDKYAGRDEYRGLWYADGVDAVYRDEMTQAQYELELKRQSPRVPAAIDTYYDGKVRKYVVVWLNDPLNRASEVSTALPLSKLDAEVERYRGMLYFPAVINIE